MPQGTPVHRCVEHVKATGKPLGNAIAICQHATKQNFKTGEPLKHSHSETQGLKTVQYSGHDGELIHHHKG